MLEMELCRICLAYGDGVNMYPIEYTYHEIFECFKQDKMDMNDELPHSVCYLCNADLKKVYTFLKQINYTEMYFKEILRNTGKLTLESVQKFKREVISKLNNEELKQKETVKNNRVENEHIRETGSEKTKNLESPQQKSKLPDQESKSPHRVQNASPEHSRENFLENEDEILSIEEDMKLFYSESEDESPSTPNKEKDEIIIEFFNTSQQSNHKSETSLSNKRSRTPDPTDSFLLCAKKYRPSEEAKPSHENVTEEAATTNLENNHSPYLECIEERVAIENEPQEKKLTFESVENLKHKSNRETISKLHNSSQEELKETETEENKKAESEEIKDIEPPQQKSILPDQESRSPHRVQKESSEHSQEKSLENEDEILSIEDIKLVWSSDSETDASPDIPTMEKGDERFIENNNSPEQSNHKPETNISDKQSKTTDPIDIFLLCAKKYRSPEERANSSKENVTEDAVTTNLEKNRSNLECIEEHVAIEKEPQEKQVINPECVEFHNQYIEETRTTEEKPPKKRLKTYEIRVESPNPEIYQSPYLQVINLIPINETEQEQIMEIEKDKIESVVKGSLGFSEKNHGTVNKTFNNKVTEEIKEAETEEIEKVDIIDETPYKVCYLCNTVLNTLDDLLKTMIETEYFVKKALGNTYKVTFRSVEKFKREMISKLHILSHEEIKETKIEEIKDAETKEKNDVVTDQSEDVCVISEEITDRGKESPHRVQKESEHNQERSLEYEDEIPIEDIKLVWSDSETDASPDIPNMEKGDERFIENNNSSKQSTR